VALLGAILLLAACQPAAAPSAQPAPAPAAAAQPGQSQPAQAQAPSGWEQQWNDLIARARGEGKVVVVGPPNPDIRTTIPAKFKDQFGIEMEYIGLPPNQAEYINRLIAEKSSGLATADVLIGGSQSIYTIAYPSKLITPFKSALIHPEVTNPAKWTSNRIWFRDPEDEYIMTISNFVTGQIYVNTDQVKPDQITSWNDLLKPEFQGKISAWEITLPGTGWNTANYLRMTLGDDYFKRLYVDQRPTFTTDARQWGDWLARGTHPIALGIFASEYERLKKEGFPLGVMPSFPEAPGVLTGGWGLAIMMENAPHPNAAKVFLNWIVMREAQEAWHKAEQTASIRTDLDNSWAPSYLVPKPGLNYFDGYEWNYVIEAFGETVPKMRAILGRN
jgi:iron(III) transport system substrate-binding protein